MEKHPPIHRSVVAIEKRAFGSSPTKVNNFTYLSSYFVFIFNPGKGVAPSSKAIEKGDLGSPSTKVANFTLFN